ncbi:bifunctional heptose 7-phosphate kinase/heptose 1-phosphate adenyltransferase [Pontiella agarivorans]|uniref:PfkB family carbohydrate kinase n=1 Tax=Pontiella agarivorans TaxID=3038953 RepID=A0ABU5N1A1_9BACT|nr:PfkB family carbohydrate kinase [Pontiella agarivorans]MDZ8120223.1 PfkB family carbohydrate kinase [Pontiella agarivorans]
MKITVERAKELLSSASQKRILVVGDLMMDRFVYGSVSRISPEAPVPVVHVSHEKAMPGGACNVASNLLALGGAAAMAGIIGRDAVGGELKKQLSANGVLLNAVIEHAVHPTCVKTRIVAEQQQVVRVDREEYLSISAAEMEAFCSHMIKEINYADGVIIEDYGKGSVQQNVVDTVLAAAQQKGIPVGYDPKDDHILKMEGVSVVTPNRKEAFGSAGVTETKPADNPLEDDALLETGRILDEKWKARHTLITLGPHGMLLLNRGEKAKHIPTRAREVFDVSGAGDTVIATYVLALACGASYLEAAELSNFAAGVVVGKLGTATCTQQELFCYMKKHADEI